MMKILMLSAHFNLPSDKVPIGGVQRHIEGLTASLVKMGHIVNWQYPSLISSKDIEDGYDIVIAHDFVCFKADVRIPQIIVFHGWEGAWPLNNTIVAKRREIAEKASAVIDIGFSINKMYGSKQGHVIYGGYDEKLKRKALRNNGRLLITSRIKKDCPNYLAVKLANLMGVGIDVCGDGDDNLKKELSVMTGDINFFGFINNVEDKMAECGFLVFGGYLTMIEAMVLRKPCFAFYDTIGRMYRITMLPEGVKVFSGDNEVNVYNDFLSHNISEVVERNSEWAKMQTWDNIAEKYLEIIDGIK